MCRIALEVTGLKDEKSGVFPSELVSTAEVKPGRWVRRRHKLCHASPWAPAAPQLLAPSCQAPGLQKPRCVLAEPPQQHRGERQQMPAIPASSSPPAAPCQGQVAGRGDKAPLPGESTPKRLWGAKKPHPPVGFGSGLLVLRDVGPGEGHGRHAAVCYQTAYHQAVDVHAVQPENERASQLQVGETYLLSTELACLTGFFL